MNCIIKTDIGTTLVKLNNYVIYGRKLKKDEILGNIPANLLRMPRNFKKKKVVV